MDFDAILEFVTVGRLIYFFIFFILVLAWVFRPGQKQKMREHAEIPLKEDN